MKLAYPYFCFFLLNLFFSIRILAQSPAIEWQNTIGGSKYDDAKSIIQTADGGYLVCGNSDSNISGDKSENKKGHEDYWVVKLDSLGNIEWDKTIGANDMETARDVIQTAAGEYIIVGNSLSDASDDKTEDNIGTGDLWLVKLDSSGNIVWENTVGGTGGEAPAQIKNCSDGGFVVCAWSRSPAGTDKDESSFTNIFGTYTADYWVIKFDDAGNILWQNTIGGNGEDYATCIVQTSDGGYLVGGDSYSDTGGDKTEDTWGSISPDYWVLKLDSIGNIQWQNNIGSENFESLYDIIPVETGSLIAGYSTGDVTGDKTETTRGNSDYWILKLNAEGSIEWQKAYGGSSQDELHAIVADTEGYILGGISTSGISGDKTLESEGNADYWTIKIDTIGNIIWQDVMGGSSSDWLENVSNTTDNSMILCGTSYSGASGDKSEPNVGQSDYWIIKLESNCTMLIYYADVDGDSFGDAFTSIESCIPVAGFTTDSSDCNDLNTDIYPGATETCNTFDDNCNGDIDEGIPLVTFYFDGDDDSYGDSSIDSTTCTDALEGYTTAGSDCNDADPYISPGEPETCNAIDDNCNLLIDEDLTIYTLYVDADGDLFGNAAIDTASCYESISGYVASNTDCDDSNPDVYPGAPEILDGLDNNCNDTIDEGFVSIPEIENSISVNIYPNPASQYFTVEINSQNFNQQELRISLLNILGEEIYFTSSKLVDGKLSETIHQHEKIPAGIYTVIITGEQEITSAKIILE